jgi:hypothetical protein
VIQVLYESQFGYLGTRSGLRDKSGRTAVMLRAGRPRNRGSNPDRCKRLPSSPNFRNVSDTHLTNIEWETETSFPGVNRSRNEAKRPDTLVPNLRMSGVVPPLPHVPSYRTH